LNGQDLTEGTGYLRSGEIHLATDDDVFTSIAAGGGGFGTSD
jgi:hypothetical protein